MQPLTQLPTEIQHYWMARLEPATPTQMGVFRLVAVRSTEPRGYEGQRITILVLDENGIAMPGVKVAFSYSTADAYTIGPEFQWLPPAPSRAFIVPTQGSGQIDQIQNHGVNVGEPGGVTVYIFTPEYSSDVVTGAGMLADHTGLHLTYQLNRVGVKSVAERLSVMEVWVTNVESRLRPIEEWIKLSNAN